MASHLASAIRRRRGRARGHARGIGSRYRFERRAGAASGGPKSGRRRWWCIRRITPGQEVRTALENLTVLSVQPQAEMSSQGVTLPVVTLLAKPAEADVLAAADSGARVRLTLRNPLGRFDAGARSL